MDDWAGAYRDLTSHKSPQNAQSRFAQEALSLTVCALRLLRLQDINEPGPFPDRVVGCDGGFSHAPEAALFPAPISGFDTALLGDITQNLQHFVAYLLRPTLVYKPKDLNRDWSPRFSTLRDKNGWIRAKTAGNVNLGVSRNLFCDFLADPGSRNFQPFLH